MNPSEELKQSLGIIAGESNDFPEEDIENEEDFQPMEKSKFEVEPIESKVPEDNSDDIANDYKYTRNVLYALAKVQGEALALALDMVKGTEHPRAFSTFNEMASSLRDTAMAINDLQKTYKTVTSGKQQPQPAIGTQNNIIGTPTDIIELLKTMDKDKEKTVDGDIIDSD